MTLLTVTPDKVPIEYQPRLIALAAKPTIIVEEAVWEKPYKTYDKTYGIDCVTTLKMSGDLPWTSVSPTNRAADIPTKPLELTEGATAVVSTREGYMGHVVKVRLVQGNLVSIREGGHSTGTGRVIPPELVKGEVNL